MRERDQEQLDDSGSAESRTEWTRPEPDRFVAGGAEGAADISTDGIDIPS